MNRRKIILYRINCALITLLPLGVYANDENNVECKVNCIYVNGALGYAADQGQDKTYFSYDIGAGININEYFDTGIKYDNISKNLEGTQVYLRASYDYNNNVDFYFSGGATNFGGNITLSTGFTYELTNLIELDIGYSIYPKSGYLNSDVYSFKIGFNYRLQGDNLEHKENIETEVNNEVPFKPDNSQSPKRQPINKEKLYVIESGDCAIEIAKKFNVSLDRLLEMNNWLKTRVLNDKYIYPGEVVVIK